MNIYKSSTSKLHSICITTHMNKIQKELHDQIIKIDQEYIEKLYGDYEINCKICNTGKSGYRHNKNNAKFLVKDFGYNLRCCKCNQVYPLNKYLQLTDSGEAVRHQIDRWKISSTGWNFNCPKPPNKALREIYKEKEDAIKKANYQKKYGSNYSS